jgi:hypothetical protein
MRVDHREKKRQVDTKWARETSILLNDREAKDREPYKAKPLACSSPLIITDADGVQKRYHPGHYYGSHEVVAPSKYPVLNPRSLSDETSYYDRKQARKSLAQAGMLA